MSYAEFIYNKNVCIVGGIDNYDADYVGTFDIVVRINNHWLRQGGSCHVVYHAGHGGSLNLYSILEIQRSLFIHLNTVLKTNMHELKAKYPQHVFLEFKRTRHSSPHPSGAQYEWLNVLQNFYNGQFFTGVIALADVVRHCPARVFVCGMNLYQGHELEKGTIGGHEVLANAKYLFDVHRFVHRVKLDVPLIDAIHNRIRSSQH